MEIQQLTGNGKRESNQDFIFIDKLESGASFFLIADGMGGYERGDEAARIVSENIFAFLNYANSINEKSIQQAIQKANLAIKQFNFNNNIKSGATIGGVIVENSTVHIFWIGDVMVYQISKDNILFSTKSHTLVNSLIESKSIVHENTLNKYTHIVTRSISGKPSESYIDYHSTIFSENDLFILCSDGIHNVVSVDQILKYIKRENGLNDFEKEFLREAQDNYSIIIVN